MLQSDKMEKNIIRMRLTVLRKELRRLGINGFIVPHADEHQGEYVAPSSERLAWLTGFTGSAGLAIVLDEKAAIFIDGRYILQAEAEVPKDLFDRCSLANYPPTDWFSDNLRPSIKVGYDPWLMTPNQITHYQAAFKKATAVLKPVGENPIDAVWNNRPAPPSSPIIIHDIAFAGQTAIDKRIQVANALRNEGSDAAVLTAPDSIAWLLNIRGGDIPFSPLTLAFAIMNNDKSVDLFVDKAKVSQKIMKHLGSGVRCHKTEDFAPALDTLNNKTVRLNTETAPIYILQRLEAAGATVQAGADPCQLPKAIKKSIQLEGIRAAHLRDGASLTRFLAWLATNAASGLLTESSAAKTLESMRLNNEYFKGLSFPTISGAGPNGAIVHYSVTPKTDRLLEDGTLYLVDSGAQYLDGTTDVTRTVAIGTPTKSMIKHFTLVLKGHIALATARFPEGTCGSQLDVLARRALWAEGLDYDHGTGHGVGHFLGVHEGPQRISKVPNRIALKPGMIISNEPGYYKTGSYGIRIENLVCVTAGTHLSFETLTLAPIDRALINTDLMEETEIAWLNCYHARVHDKISPLVDPDTRSWLTKATTTL
jgi:Xaa-Pro aminopeptidase